MSSSTIQPAHGTAVSDERFDEMERALMAFPQAELGIGHIFTPGLYCRSMSAPAGSTVTSKIHKTRHPFVVLRGRLLVRTRDDEEWAEIAAPFMGITEPGTRRVARVIEDTVWVTFHPTELTDVDAIEAQIIEPRTAHLDGLVQPTLEQAKEAVCLGQR